MAPSVAAMLAVLELARAPLRTGSHRALALDVGMAGGLDQAIARPSVRVYRAQPEVVLGFRAANRLHVFAGGGLGPAYVVGRRRGAGRVDLSVSGALGLSFPLAGGTVEATARTDAVAGSGVAISLHLRMSFAPAR